MGETVEDELAAVAELRTAITEAMAEAEEKEKYTGTIARDRCLQNAFIPKTPEGLLEAAMQCLPYFALDPGGATEVPRGRFETLLTRLELLAVDDPTLAQKASILRQKLSHYQSQERRFGFTVVAVVVGAVVLLAWIVWRLT